MKITNKKVVCQGVRLDDSKEHELNLEFDDAFVGKVTIRCRKFGRTVVLEVATDGVEYF